MSLSFRVFALAAAFSFFALGSIASGPAIAGMAMAETVAVGDLIIKNPWIRQAPPGAKVVGGYALITNNGTVADRLLGGTADFARHIEVHEMRMTDGIMKMRPLAEGLTISPGETVELRPGSFHLMFMGATSPKAGETVAVTLRFARAGNVTVNLPVAPIGASEAPHNHGN